MSNRSRGLWILMVLVAMAASCGDDGGITPPYLIRTVQVPEGSDTCPRGGIKLEGGQDLNGDGMLTPDEADPSTTQYICTPEASKPSILGVEELAPGELCANGGQRISSGIDANENGVLDEDEASTSTVICNGESSVTDIQSLIALRDEPPGEHCANGGKIIESGIDLSGDGVLDPAEVTSSDYICNIEGVDSLIDLVSEPPGEHCPNGGQKLIVATDSNANGIIDDGEQVGEEYLCDPAHVKTQVKTLEQDPYQCLRGGIQIDTGVDLDGNGLLTGSEIENTQVVCNNYPLYAKQVAAGTQHACVVLSNGTVQCWGDNRAGQVGAGFSPEDEGFRDFYDIPMPVPTIENALKVAAGYRHTCVLVWGGKAYCWGLNQFGQLGNGESNGDPALVYTSEHPNPLPEEIGDWVNPETPSTSYWPTQVALDGISDICTGLFHSCAVADGQVYCWGGNWWGQLGLDASEVMDATPVPTLVSGVSNAIAVSCGAKHSCAITENGEAFCWGNNASGQLGNGMTLDAYVPEQVFQISNATAIEAGLDHTCAIEGDRFYCWGDNNYGQLGNGNAPFMQSLPVDVNRLQNPFALASGPNHSCGVMEDGNLSCWGKGSHGQLGNDLVLACDCDQDAVCIDEDLSPSTVPVCQSLANYWVEDPVDVNRTGLKEEDDASEHPSAGEPGLRINDPFGLYVALDVSAGGKLLPLASGDDSDPATLTFAGLLTGELQTGPDFSCMISSDGKVYCWGSNDRGQIGMGTGPRLVPNDQLRWCCKVTGDDFYCNWMLDSSTDEYLCQDNHLTDIENYALDPTNLPENFQSYYTIPQAVRIDYDPIN